MMAKEIYHSPDWYEARVSEDYINPAVKHMLINDVGDEYDSRLNSLFHHLTFQTCVNYWLQPSFFALILI